MSDLDELAQAARGSYYRYPPFSAPRIADGGWVLRGLLMSIGAAPVLIAAVAAGILLAAEVVKVEVRSAVEQTLHQTEYRVNHTAEGREQLLWR